MELIEPMDHFFPFKIASMNDCLYSQIIAYLFGHFIMMAFVKWYAAMGLNFVGLEVRPQ